MTTIFYVILLACSLLLSGCSSNRQTNKDKTQEKVASHMIKIQNLEVTEKTLTLDYAVLNPLDQDIWVCEDIDIYGKYDVETRIDSETVLIKLSFNLPINMFREPGAFAKYRLLSPEESHSGKILLNLPIRNASPVYNFHEDGKKHEQIVLHRAVFEVGYFEGNLEKVLLESIYKGKRDPTNEQLYFEMLMLVQIQYADSGNTVYLHHRWPGLSMEKSAKVVITDVNIPCSIAVDE